ncbi:hypothetical protein ABK040_007241 [Willaertia magna]
MQETSLKQVTIGVDGGGTGTTIVVIDNENKQVLIRKNYGPCNKNSIGNDKAKKVLQEGIIDILTSIQLTIENVKAICLGLSGVDRSDDIQLVKEWMNELLLENNKECKVYIFNDAIAAICSGTLGKLENSMCLIAGTGSICLGTNNNGESFIRSGGWGPLLGDKGNGYYIGSRVLTSVVRSFDGLLGKDTLLIDLLKEKLEIKEMSELITYIYKDREWSRTAQFAPLAFEAYKKGDEVAKEIIEELINDLFDLISVTVGKLKFKEEGKKFTIVFCGSILTHEDSIVASELSKKLKEAFGDLISIIEKPLVDPAEGSALYFLNNKQFN